MQDELRKVVFFFFQTRRGKSYLTFGLIFIIITISLYALNYYFLIDKVEPEFFNEYASVRFTLFESLNPYQDMNSRLSDLSATYKIERISSEPAFGLPLFTLFIYFPFASISNYLAAQALWMAINQILVIYMLFITIKLFEWEIDYFSFLFLAIISLFFYPIWFNVLDQNLSIIQAGFLLTSMYHAKKENFIVSGIFLGLCLINPFYFMIPIILFIGILIKNKKSAAVLWMMITSVMLLLSSLIIQSDWILDYIKYMVFDSSIFPFNSSADNFSFTLGLSGNTIYNIIPFAAISWLIAEWLRTPFIRFQNQFWLVSLSFVLGQFITIQPDTINATLLLPVFIFIAYLWDQRTEGKFKYFVFILGALLSFGLLVIQYLNKNDIFFPWNYQIFNIIASTLLVINLYWVRAWAVSTYLMEDI